MHKPGLQEGGLCCSQVTGSRQLRDMQSHETRGPRRGSRQMRGPRIEHRTWAVFAIKTPKRHFCRARLGGPAILNFQEVTPFWHATLSCPKSPFSGQALYLPLPKPAEQGTFSVILANTEASPSHGRPGTCSGGCGSVTERRLSPFPVRGPHCPQLWGTGLILYLANYRQLHAMAFGVWSQTSQ